ncbi:hypothetical protein GE09DRAFT_1082137 [Coniochaeta sp. 2T2.1]|nr:hypothetical protein GE09DRAFT_1082137 [Coniochaeta sp. 2T2.1]
MSSNSPNPNNKGKGKEKDDPAPSTGHPTDPDSSPDPSLLSRITTSTTTLASSLLSGPPSNTILASATADKASSSSQQSAQISHAESSSANFQPAPVSSTSTSTSQQPFRTTQSHSHAAEEEAAFSSFLDDVPVFQPGRGEETWHMSTPDPVAVNVDFTPSSAREAEAHDGEAVISLLSSPTTHLPDTLVDDPLTPEQQTSLRNALFGGPHPTSSSNQNEEEVVDWNHILNFIPPYLRQDEPSLESYLDTGLEDPAEAWQSWVGQWEGVLNRYDDEVWGDLGGLVGEARREVEELKRTRAAGGEEGGRIETPALRRLRGILGHLRG